MIEIYTVNKITKSDALCDEDYVLASDYEKLEAEVAAANATLDRLREVVPSREHCMHCCQCGMIMAPRPTLDVQECPNCFAMLQEIPGKLIDILYPTPENDND